MPNVSSHFRRLGAEEISGVVQELDASWTDPHIPRRQWVSVVRAELQRYREGVPQPHFDVLLRALRRIPVVGDRRPSLLDVGAASGFYSELFRIAGFECDYVALDYSSAFKSLAEELFPGIAFQVADARSLPYADGAFDIVLSGCCLIHIFEYEKAIEEAARVASQYVILNRTPIASETRFYEKQAYGVRCLEIHFDERELFEIFKQYGLALVSNETVTEDGDFSQRTYLLRKT